MTRPERSADTRASPNEHHEYVGVLLDQRYRVEALLGLGGAGLVFAAKDLDSGVDVAVKVLRPELATDPSVASRFVREARAASALHSEHVARVLAFGAMAGGEPFIVTERLYGRDLADEIASPRPMTVARAADLVLQATEGLIEAHAAGIIHRDIKPSNVFLTDTESGVRVKILDFGACRSAIEDDQLTRPNEVIGTPRYMSPEQVSGEALDAKTDIWALGAILYEMLAKEPAFAGTTTAQVFVSIMNDAPPLITRARPDVPASFADLVARCMERDRAARPSASTLRDELAAYAGLERHRSETHVLASVPRLEDRPPTQRIMHEVIPPAETPLESVPKGETRLERSSSPRAGESRVDLPRWLGDYALGELLATGGMGTVHIGVKRAASGRLEPVVIKRLRRELSTAAYDTMLADEARVTSKVRHPNVVSTLDEIVVEGERMIALEYVPGVSLSQALRAVHSAHRAIPIGVVVRLILDLLSGVNATHDARDEHGQLLDVVHRDISPHNILVHESGVAKLTDFGIAVWRGRFQRTTMTGVLKGKLGYLAPEQIHGSSSRAADIYACGAVLWEMLSGRELVRGTDGEVLAATLLGKHEPPSTHAKEAEPLDDVVMKAIHHEPGSRFATAQEMADAIVARVALASHAEVSVWLAQILGPELERRRQLVARSLADASEGPGLAPTARITTARRPRRWLLMSVLAVGLLTGVGALALGTRSTEKGAIAPISSPSMTSSSSTPPEPASSMSELTPPPAPTIRSPTSVTSRPTKPPKRPTPRGAPKPNCATPYTVDAEGHTIWRRECFQNP